MAFEKYKKIHHRLGDPQITVAPRGQISINLGAILKYKLDQYNFAVLFYDMETKTVGMKFITDKDDPDAMKLTKREGAGFIISAMTFFRSYDIVHSKTKKYDFGYDKKYDLYTFHVDPKGVK